jgi:hypothetical protein
MQEKLDTDSRASPWEVYFYEEGGWVLLEAFGSENDARVFLGETLGRSGLPEDYYALVGPEDKVMPLAPASARQ